MSAWKDPLPGNDFALTELRRILESREAIAFVGAGASAGLYPLWTQLIKMLADEAVSRGFATASVHKQWLKAYASPQSIASAIEKSLGTEILHQKIYEYFCPKKGVDGNNFTPAHAATVQLPLKGVVTTNYDPGLVEARHELRRGGASFSYSTWKDTDAVLRWSRGEIFAEQQLPILFAHGSYERGETIVLTSANYIEAYETGAYRRLFGDLWLRERMVFIGYGFKDSWLEYISSKHLLDLIHKKTGPPRHVAIIGIRKSAECNPSHRRMFQEQYGCHVYYYRIAIDPHGHEDHGELTRLLTSLSAPNRPAFRRRPR